MRDGTDFVLADLYPPKPARDRYEVIYSRHAIEPQEVNHIILEILEYAEYGVRRFENGFILLQRGFMTALNQGVRREILSLAPAAMPRIIAYFSDPAERVTEIRRSESDRFTDFLKRHGEETVLIVGNGDVASKLSYMGTMHLIYRGSNIHLLRKQGSYIAVFQGNRIVFEIIDNRSVATVSAATSEELRKVLPGVDVSMLSAGRSATTASSSIEIGGTEFCLYRRDLNVTVLNHTLNVITQASFDTGR
jgi:hypothetical protein